MVSIWKHPGCETNLHYLNYGVIALTMVFLILQGVQVVYQVSAVKSMLTGSRGMSYLKLG